LACFSGVEIPFFFFGFLSNARVRWGGAVLASATSFSSSVAEAWQSEAQKIDEDGRSLELDFSQLGRMQHLFSSSSSRELHFCARDVNS
jgi:hypothetical protein